MGQPVISLSTLSNDSKSNLEPCTSVHSVDNVTFYPAQNSRVQLFELQLSIEESKWQPTVRDRLLFICIVILTMMEAVDATVLIAVLPYLGNIFKDPFVNTFWVNTAYLIFNAASQPFFTIFCEVFSHGPVWIIAVVCTTIGTGICSGSMSLTELIIGRAVQGIGGGGAMCLCFLTLAESTPKSLHARYSCYILLIRMIGISLGPALGGLFADHAQWEWTFYSNMMFCALGLLLIPFAVDLRVFQHLPLRKLQGLDWLGPAMACIGLGSILLGVSWGGTSYKWNQWQTLVPIAVGAAVMCALAFYECKGALHPHLGPRDFQSRALTMTYIGFFCHGFVIFNQLQFFTIYFVSAKFFSVTLAGISLLAITGFAITPAAVVGILLATEPRCSRWIIPGGWIITTLAAGCSILLDMETPTIGWVILLFTAGLGHGLLMSGYNIHIHGIPEDERNALSKKPVQMSHFVRAWGMAFAVPVGSVVFLNLFGKELQAIVLQPVSMNSSDINSNFMDPTVVSDMGRQAIGNASTIALQVVWEVIIGVSAVGGISSSFLGKR